MFKNIFVIFRGFPNHKECPSLTPHSYVIIRVTFFQYFHFNPILLHEISFIFSLEVTVLILSSWPDTNTIKLHLWFFEYMRSPIHYVFLKSILSFLTFWANIARIFCRWYFRSSMFLIIFSTADIWKKCLKTFF